MYKKQHIQFCSLALITILLLGCQSGRELHYFKSGDNYYRLKIRESSFASKARYLSGYFDEKAVDRYFGEMTQPLESDTVRSNQVQFFQTDYSDYTPDKLKIDSMKKLVLILSTNSNAISEQIGAFAENDRIMSAIMELTNKDQIQENLAAQNTIEDIKRTNAAIKNAGDRFIATIANGASAAEIKNNIQAFLTHLQGLQPGNNDGKSILFIPKF